MNPNYAGRPGSIMMRVLLPNPSLQPTSGAKH